MRTGWIVSIIFHVGAVWVLTMVAARVSSDIPPASGVIVPIEVVDVAEESNVRALAVEVPEEEQSPQAAETIEAEPEPAPAPAAPTPQRERRNRAEEFDLAAIARMVDTQSKTGRRQQEGAPAERDQQGAGLGTAEVASLVDLNRSIVRRHLLRCWRMPIDLPEPERLVVTLEFELDRNGNLRGQPRVTSPRNYSFDAPMRAAVEAALRAVRTCEPYPFPNDRRLAEHYDIWDEQEFTFRPQAN